MQEMKDTRVLSLGGEDPLEKGMVTNPPTPAFLPGKSHGQRSPEGYSPQGHKEVDMTEHAQDFIFLQLSIHTASTIYVRGTEAGHATHWQGWGEVLKLRRRR